jgi:ArsR family transcriptional regulator
MRLRLLAIAAQEELSIGELAELLEESQPNVSRHLAPLRRLDLVAVRKQGTRVLVRLVDSTRTDPVVADALAAGRALCTPDATLDRIAALVRRRDAASREFFSRANASGSNDEPAVRSDELPAYLMALSPLLARHALAVDMGTGEGRLLDMLAPLFDRVLAVDREPAQLARARKRATQRGYENIELLQGDLDAVSVINRVRELGLADAVFASRMLHHAPRPAHAVAQLGGLVREGGTVVILDYLPHDDEHMRDAQADLWLGFAPDELRRYAAGAGLVDVRTRQVPAPFRGSGPDRHLGWQVFSARRA